MARQKEMGDLSSMSMEQYIPSYEHYSYRAKEVLVHACRLALQAGRSWLTGPDLLAGLLADPQEEGSTCLTQLGIDLATLNGRLTQLIFSSVALSEEVGVEGGLSQAARSALNAAAAEAGYLGHERIEPLHLLLGLIACQQRPLAEFVAGSEALEQARQLIQQRLAARAQSGADVKQEKQGKLEPEVVLIDMAHQQAIVSAQRSLVRKVRLWLAIIGCLLLAFAWFPSAPLSLLTVSFPGVDGDLLLTDPVWRLLATLKAFLIYWLLGSLIGFVPLVLLLLQSIRAQGILRSSPGYWLRFQFSRWLSLTLALSLVIGLAAVLQVAMPAWWWLPVWLLIVIWLLFSCWWVSRPASLLPAARYPLPPGEIQQRCANLLQRLSLRLEGIYVYETEGQLAIANAYATGLGSRRRIWLTDSLLKHFPPDEIEVLCAHEMAHHVHNDLLWRIGLSALYHLAWLLLWQLMLVSNFPLTSKLGQVALVMALLALWLNYRVLHNSLSYRQEMRADRFALERTGLVRAYRNAVIRLANLSAASARGGWGERPTNRSYPSLAQRLAQADLFSLQQRGPASKSGLPR